MIAIFMLLAALWPPTFQSSLMVEAEYFDHPGGWTVEGQFYEQVGSQYVFAHGLGKPVEDAVTTVQLPRKGRYNIWVRTYNWNSPWDPSQAPGVFQLIIDGNVVAPKLGDKPVCWGWQEAGTVEYDGTPMEVALHDLTGFDARCDGIFFSISKNPAFPSDKRDIRKRREKEKYDLIVVGGGPAGIGAAVAAARLGVKTLLLESRGDVGGNAAPGMNISVSGYVKMAPYRNIGNVISEYGNVLSDKKKVTEYLCGEPNLTVRTNCRVIDANTSRGKIRSVTALDMKSGEGIVYSGSYFADCTGDGNLGVLCGAEYMQGAETADVFSEDLAPATKLKRSYGSSIKWSARHTGTVSDFPLTPWAVQFDEETAMKQLKSNWNFEAGYTLDQIKDAEQIRDYLYRVTYGNWSYLKNSPGNAQTYSDAELSFVGVILGKRESRRIVGDYILTQNDIEGNWQERYNDGALWCSYPIDQHFPLPANSEAFPGSEFLATMQHNHNPLGVSRKYLTAGVDYQMPYMMPYRCLYSKHISNLFIAGRVASVSRIALCSVRVEATCSLMGEVVAVASMLCRKLGCTPREIYQSHLPELKEALIKGVPAKYPATYKMN